MKREQPPLESLDLSIMLRQVMAVRGLSVGDMAELGAVSKSAMEKYLAGPSSPRAVTIANLSRELKLSADTLMFGQLDTHVEVAYRVAFRVIADLLKELKGEPELAGAFASLEPGTEAFADFVRDLTFERAGIFRRAFNAERRDEHFVTIG